MRWHVGRRRLSFNDAGNLCLMGVLNVTPDSFSDGGRFIDLPAALAHVSSTLSRADIIDVGGESTRPGADPVPADVEIARVVPLIEALRAQGCPALVSIDTSKADVARAAVDAGADIVNDVTGLSDPRMRAVVASTKVGAVVMHMRGRPKTMQQGNLGSDDIVGAVLEFFEGRLADCRASGIDDAAICLDPGIGFGKTVAQNVALIAGLPRLAALGRPILIGASRKSFLGALTGRPVGDREAGTLAVGACAHWLGAHVLRVHDVEAAYDARAILSAIRSATQSEAA
ncbi:MAG: dihydropteroate synthase [Bradymonadia bacterium]|jgi:dihydropteroate synthase